MSAPARVDEVLALADDELVLGWRDSEWTGVAPYLEEDVAFSSIAQNEIGHARALYELAAAELGTSADELAFDRPPEAYRCCPLVELHRLEWAATIARHFLYETADALRVAALMEHPWEELAALARKIEREEAYHRVHAGMWVERLGASAEGRERLGAALGELFPYALGMLPAGQRDALREHVAAGLPWLALDGEPGPEHERGHHTHELPALWEEMTMVRRSAPGAAW